MWQAPIRSVTVRAINLVPLDTPTQLTLFSADIDGISKAEALDRCIEDLRARYGKHIIRNACLLDNPKMPDYDHKVIMPTGIPI